MTGLCVLPGCRIRGRHLTTCDGECSGCLPRATDGNACETCAARAAGHLAVIVELTPDARLVASGLVRRGAGSGSNKPGSRSPINDAATDALDEVQNTLTTLAREIADVSGFTPPRSLRDDPIIAAARWLAGQVEWLRHASDGAEPRAVAAFAEIAACASRVRGLVNGSAGQRFLGPCGAPLFDDITTVDPEHGEGIRTYVERYCTGDVYAREGAQDGSCRTCGAGWAVGDRQRWLDAEVRSRAFRATEIEDAYGIKANLIRQWATPDRNLVQVHGTDRQGRRLYLLSQVLAVAAAQKAKRAEAQAKRARRAATRAARTEGATA